MQRILCLVSLLSLILFRPNAEPTEDKQALLHLVEKLAPSRSLNWNTTTSPCTSWTGVTCNSDNSRVIAIHLPGFGFHGTIPPNTLSRVTCLQTLSLRSNSITGPLPSDFSNLSNLSFLYLQFNNFSGPLPDFSASRNLSVLDLSNNCFTGTIPLSLSHLTHLTAINLANNSLSGQIPLFLRRFPNSAFVGNNVSLQTISHSKSAKHGEKTLFLVVVAAASSVALATFLVFIFVCWSRKKKRDSFARKLQKGDMSPERVVSRDLDVNNKIFFFEGCSYAFDLEDLLRASAEVLGKGTFGAAYKAALEDATTVVVKRLKEVAVGKRDFEQHMEVVGNLKHENVVQLKGYYYSKDEKLMVYDYYTQGSLSALLHGMYLNFVSLHFQVNVHAHLCRIFSFWGTWWLLNLRF